MKKIYIAHPYGGELGNKQKVENYLKTLYKTKPGNLYISPIHALGFLYSEMDYITGMEYCFALLEMCDEIWMCGDWEESRGCNIEWGYAKARGIPIRYID